MIYWSDPLNLYRDNVRLALKACEAYLIANKASYDDLKTVGYFGRVLNHNVLLLYNGDMSESEFVDDLADLVEKQFIRAWNEGARDVGVSPEQMTDVDLQERDDLILEQYNYIENYAAEIAQASRDGTSVAQYQARADMWANRYNEARDSARIYFSRGTGQLFEWVLGPTNEHCRHCGTLAGIVARADEWDASGYRPQSEDLECRGFNCLCELQPSDKPRTEGGIPYIE